LQLTPSNIQQPPTKTQDKQAINHIASEHQSTKQVQTTSIDKIDKAIQTDEKERKRSNIKLILKHAFQKD